MKLDPTGAFRIHTTARRSREVLLIGLGLSLFTACASPRFKPQEEASKESEAASASQPPSATPTSREQQLQGIITQLSNRLEELEGKLTALNDKLDATRAGVETLALSNPSAKGSVPTTVAVLPNPVDASRSAGIPNRPASSSTAAFSNDAPISQYRKAMILLETGKERESILEFGYFLESYPDHVLAGSAQYHIGESYFKQGEFKIAAQELQRVLTTYDRSTFVPETLKLLSISATQLKDESAATRHKQTLLSMYPQSPAARSFMNAPQPQAAEAALPSSSTPASTSTTPGLDSPPETSLVPTAPSGLDSLPEQTPEHGGH